MRKFSDMIKINEADKSIADKDAEEVKKLHHMMVNTIGDIGEVVEKLKSNVSSFNSPGAISAFLNAIKHGISDYGLDFDYGKAAREINKYVDRK